MKISVILTTYNKPLWLEKVIWGYAIQKFRNFELVIADDGSARETSLLIARLRRKTGLEIQHIWHPDRGYRKCTIQNRAIVAATGDYLVITDGDCIPRETFLSCHHQHARSGVILSGGYVRLPLSISEKISIDDVIRGRATDGRWLWKQGLRWPKSILKAMAGPVSASLLDRWTVTRATFNGCNTSLEREAVLRVNGFDERMQYGGSDRELGERLENLGLRHQHVRHRAVCMHLWHGRPYMTDDGWTLNGKIREETRRNKSVWTQHGIQQSSNKHRLTRAA